MLRKLILSALPIATLALLTGGQMSDNGKAGRTGSPGETNCTNCHSTYALNSGGGSVSIQSPMTNFQYTPGQTYSMSVTVERSANSLFGVDIEALTSTNDNAGTLAITDAGSTQIKTTTVSGISRRNIVHTLNGGANPASKVFNFSWTAPAAGTGNVTFYFNGVAANGNGNENTDYVYASSQVFTEASACVPPVANISVSGDSLYSTPGASYEWYLNGNFTGVTTSYIVPVQNGTYEVIVYDAGGCFGTSVPFVYSSVGVNSIDAKNQIMIFQNQVSNVINVNVPDEFINSQLLMVDISGRTVRQAVLHTGENTVETNGLSEGIYTVLAGDGNNKMFKRIFISK